MIVHVLDDSTARPIIGAHVGVAGTSRGDYTDTTGVARLLRLMPGSRVLVIGRLGYRSERIPVELSAGAPVETEVRLTLDPVRLTALEVAAAERRNPYLARQGVYSRTRFGGTVRLGPEFERKTMRTSFLHELFWGFPGLEVILNRYGTGHILRSTRGTVSLTLTCYPDVFLDGVDTQYMRFSRPDVDQIVPAYDVAAIEFYAGPAEAPMEFGAVSPCGTVLIWTKHGG